MQIYLLRHGAAEDAGPGMDDAERALTPEGIKKLREVLKLAKIADVEPDLVMTSPYRRAVETAEIAKEVLGYQDELFRTKVLVPDGRPQDVWEEIRIHRDAQQLLLAGHLPNIGRAVGYLLGAPDLLVDMKKAAMVRIDLEQFGATPRGILKWMITPKLV